MKFKLGFHLLCHLSGAKILCLQRQKNYVSVFYGFRLRCCRNWIITNNDEYCLSSLPLCWDNGYQAVPSQTWPHVTGPLSHVTPQKRTHLFTYRSNCLEVGAHRLCYNHVPEDAQNTLISSRTTKDSSESVEGTPVWGHVKGHFKFSAFYPLSEADTSLNANQLHPSCLLVIL